MRVAIIGGGISGLSLGYFLNRESSGTVDFILYEANRNIGGHTYTVEVPFEGVEEGGKRDHVGGRAAHRPNQLRGRFTNDVLTPDALSIDMGFIVYNERTYPRFCEILAELGVTSQVSEMSFSVSCEKSGLEYRGLGLNGLFAQRRNLLNIKFQRMFLDWYRFNRLTAEFLKSKDYEMTVDEFFRQYRFGSSFVNHYFMPMGSAVWSCPHSTLRGYPIRFLMEFYRNHGLVGLDIPQWRVIEGGSHAYVRKMIAPWRDRIRAATPVASVRRRANCVEVYDQTGDVQQYDRVVFACHSDQALQVLGDQATARERSILSCFPYEKNSVILHTDERMMPRRRRAWASWNYYQPTEPRQKSTVTYYMNRLQNLPTKQPYLVTLNRDEDIDPCRVIRQVNFAHPQYTIRQHHARQRIAELNGTQGTYFCGAYWGNGFHEDGVESAWQVFRSLQVDMKRYGQLHLRGMGSAQAV